MAPSLDGARGEAKIMKKVLLSIFTTLIILAPTNVSALTVVPPIYDEIVAQPGELITYEIQLFNEEPRTLYLTFDSKEFTVGGVEGQQTFFDSAPGGVSEWITTKEKTLSLAKNDADVVTVYLQIPGDAADGSYYGALFMVQTSDDPEEVGIEKRMGIPFLVRVGDLPDTGVSLDEFKIKDEQWFFAHKPIEFETWITNSSRVHVKPYGVIEVKNLIWQTKHELLANPYGANVLGESTRVIRTQYGADLERGDGFWSELKVEWQDLSFGIYRAKIELDYKTDGQLLADKLYYVVLPWRVILLFLSLVILIALAHELYKRLIINLIKKTKTK